MASTLLLLSALGGTAAQNYGTGVHTLQSGLGDIRTNVGFVSHLNSHTFHVYTFLFRPEGEERWHQLPLVRHPAEPELSFTFHRTTTADFTTSDARVGADASGVILWAAQLRFESTPYEDGTGVHLETFRLKHLDQENRWIFEKEGESWVTIGRTIEDVLDDAGRHELPRDSR